LWADGGHGDAGSVRFVVGSALAHMPWCGRVGLNYSNVVGLIGVTWPVSQTGIIAA
jgi:hypothetical protein